MTAPVLQFKRGLLANLPGLRAGEPGFTTDSYDLYVGIDSSLANNKFFGSHRYWTKETTSTGSGVNLVEGTSNGSNYIRLQSPDSLAGNITYYLPGVQGNASSVLTNDGNGNLAWASGSDSPTFTGIATFTDTTDNTLGNANTGAVQIDGGIGVNKNATIGANLNVQGYSQFVGVSTFTGAIDANGGADISGGETTLSSATVSDLTDNRVVIAGTSGSLEDDANFTYDGTDLSVNSLIVTDLTSNRVLLAGTGGSVEDSGNLTFDGSTLTVTGEIVVNSGVSTFTGLIDANAGADIFGQTDLDDVNVSGIITAANVVFGSGTAITSVDIDLSSVSSSDDTLASAKAIKSYVDAVVTAQDLDIQGDVGGTLAIDLDSEVLTIAGTTNEIETSGSGNTITIGLPDNVVIGAGLTVTGPIDGNGGATIDNIRIGIADNNEIDTSTGNLTIDSAGGTTTIDDELIVSGDVRINGNDIKSSDGQTNITLTSNTLTTFGGDIRVSGNDIQASDGTTAISMASGNVTVASNLTVGGNTIKASDGTTALTLADSTGAVTAASDLTINGNLYVSGNTTQVNTAALTVEDRTIDLGIVNGAAPASATTWDLGVLFNYHAGGSAKKSAVIWEHGDTRFKFASVLASDTNGSDNDTPQLSVTTFAPIEIGALWVNDCAGSSQVISCTGTERFLENITVDAGTF